MVGDCDPELDDDCEPIMFTRSCTVQLERAACDGKLLDFCCVYPDMCGEDAPDNTCRAVTTDESEFCSVAENSPYCCQ